MIGHAYSPLTVTLVTAARPELLEATLKSFGENIFNNFEIGHAYANIDPIFGSSKDVDRTEDVIRSCFKDVTIRRPKTASFGAAVKWLWSNINTPWGLHLEDDWQLLCAVSPADLLAVNADGLPVALVPLAEEHGAAPDQIGILSYQRVGFLGFRRWVPVAYGTSPRFLNGAFARKAASLMQPDLDPEKQARSRHNPELYKFVHSHQSRFLKARQNGIMLRDTGRQWREERGIVKVVSEGRSSWVETSQTMSGVARDSNR